MKTITIFTVFFLACLPGLVNAQIKVFDGGNVSIGSTLAPASGCRLQMVGKSVFTQNTQTIVSAACIRGMNSYSTASAPDFTWYSDDNTGFFHPSAHTLGLSIASTELMRFASSGNILIGLTTDWGYKLAINAGNQTSLASYVAHDTDYMYGQISYVNRPLSKALAVIYATRETFKVYGNGDVWSYGSYLGSDILLKENIIPITDALEKVMNLNGVYFNYKPDVLNDPNDTITFISSDPPKILMGLIAEEVEPIVPEVVKTFEDGLKGISYGNLVALLIEAIKEQALQINSLEQMVLNYNEGRNSQKEETGKDKLKNEEQNIQTGMIDQNWQNKKPVLYQNVPNPFNKSTKIQYYLPESSLDPSIIIFDMQGSLLRTYKLISMGSNYLEISAGELKPGMYMYSLISNGMEIDTKKMILTN